MEEQQGAHRKSSAVWVPEQSLNAETELGNEVGSWEKPSNKHMVGFISPKYAYPHFGL